MKKLKSSEHSEKQERNKQALHGGAYTLIMTGVVLAILVVVNVLVNALPPSVTKYDVSASRLYSVTSHTKTVLSGLKDDVTIYWIVQSGEEDDIIENLLAQYDALSDHVHVVRKNPDVYPTFAKQYTTETVKNNSLIIECGERSRFVSYDDIYLHEPDLSKNTYNNSFDGEGAITSAIDYVVTEDLPKLLVLEGHGEAEIAGKFKDEIEKANMEMESLSLLNVDVIPEDADAVLIYAPANDISPEEKAILQNYTDQGGKLMVIAGPTPEGQLTNLYSILGDYGIQTPQGIVVEGDRAHFAFQQPYILMPDIMSDPIMDPLSEEHYYPIIPMAQGMVLPKETVKGQVTPLLMTSDTAYSKPAGFDLSTYEKEEGDVDGPFATAVRIDCSNSGKILWFSSSYVLEDLYNAYSSGANINMIMNGLSSMTGEREAMNIRTKSLNYNYLTISESTASMLKMVMIGVFPILYLGTGIGVVVYRKRKRRVLYEES